MDNPFKKSMSKQDLINTINKYFGSFKQANADFDSLINKVEQLDNKTNAFEDSVDKKIQEFDDFLTTRTSKMRNAVDEIEEYHCAMFVSDDENKSIKAKFDEYYNAMFIGIGENESIKSEFEEYYETMFVGNNDEDSMKSKFEKYYETIFVGNDDEDSMKSEFEKYYDLMFVDGDEEDEKSIKSRIDNTTNKIDKYYHDMFVDDEEKKSIKSEFDEYYNTMFVGNEETDSIKLQIENELKHQRAQYTNTQEELKEKILDLLPEAGAAGLSSAYFEAKKRYGTVPKKENEKYKLWKTIKEATPAFGYYFMFLAPLAFMTYMFYSVIENLSASDKLDYTALIIRFVFYAPLGIISLFGWSSIRTRMRLYEEYNHKQRVMQLYRSFVDEIRTAGNDEQQQKLLDIMLENVADKPSLTVRKKMNSPINIFSKIIPGEKQAISEPKKDE
ncbi:MAG: hypothetical protein ACR2N8_04850 [Parvibaculales bacterium]